jgi:hypothetical protein
MVKSQRLGQRPHVARQGLSDSGCRLRRHPDEHHVPRVAFDQRRDLRVDGAGEQVAFPVPGHGAVDGLGGARANRNGVGERAARHVGGSARATHTLPPAQMPQ